MKKFLRKIHLWLSIPAGLIIFLVCLSGAILVFQQEILEMNNPSHYFVKDVAGRQPLPLDQLIPLVNAQLDSNSVAAVQVTSDPSRTYTMTLKEGFRVSAFVDPYTGEVKGHYYFREHFFFYVMRLHRWLMDDTRTWGKYAVGISTLLFVLILITGLFIQPSRFFKKSTFVVHTRRGGKRLLYDLHNVLGIYACIILIVGALTGLMWSFDWYRNGVFKLFGAETQQTRGGHGGGNRQPNTVHWQTVLQQLRTENPDNKYIRIQDGTASVHLKSAPTSRATDKYTFDPRSGAIKTISLYKDSEGTAKIWGWVYSLHVGNIWGMWSKIPTFLAALVGASLPVTGYWLYFKKLSRKRKRKEKAKMQR